MTIKVKRKPPMTDTIQEALEFKQESKAFEEYALRKEMDMDQHPLHYLFLNKETDFARDVWKVAIAYSKQALLNTQVNETPKSEHIEETCKENAEKLTCVVEAVISDLKAAKSCLRMDLDTRDYHAASCMISRSIETIRNRIKKLEQQNSYLRMQVGEYQDMISGVDNNALRERQSEKVDVGALQKAWGILTTERTCRDLELLKELLGSEERGEEWLSERKREIEEAYQTIVSAYRLAATGRIKAKGDE